jgi:ribonucleoside-diphosphate reductase alpha chain
LNVSEDALKLLKEKEYFKQEYNESSWEDICKRVSVAIASVEETLEMREKIETEIFNAMSNLEFIFSTPVLLNADINNPGQLSSCFILETKDTIEDICKLDAQFSKIFQKNGGAGTDLSVLRPAKATVNASKGYAGGVIAFMEKYDATADTMTRNNPSRKGKQMCPTCQ